MLTGCKHPVTPLCHTTSAHMHDLSWPYLMHACVDRTLGRLYQYEDFTKAVLVHPWLHIRVSQNRLRLGAEQHAIRCRVEEQRLDTQTVPDQDQLLRPQVPDGESKHAVEPLGNPVSPLQIPAEDHFRIAARSEAVAEALQLLAQFHEVINLSVVDESSDRAAIFLCQHRLRATDEIDDRKPPMPESYAPVDPYTLVIRPALRQRRGHGGNDIRVSRKAAVITHPSGDSAHLPLLAILSRKTVLASRLTPRHALVDVIDWDIAVFVDILLLSQQHCKSRRRLVRRLPAEVV